MKRLALLVLLTLPLYAGAQDEDVMPSEQMSELDTLAALLEEVKSIRTNDTGVLMATTFLDTDVDVDIDDGPTVLIRVSYPTENTTSSTTREIVEEVGVPGRDLSGGGNSVPETPAVVDTD